MRTRKGVIVVDVKGSPLWRAATSHSRTNAVEVVSAIDFLTTRSLVRAIIKSQPDFVIFSWRGALDRVFQSRYWQKKLLVLDPWIFLLIPDYLGVKPFYRGEQDRIDMCDGVLVTSRGLVGEYEKLYEVDNIQLLHDLPDMDLIQKVRGKNLTRVKNRVIWVGNSKWGERAGYLDHKGLRRFVLPLQSTLGMKLDEVDFMLIDSADNQLSHMTVLEEIAKSECLILTSDSEGTGLPILEAAALGVPVVTFDVGVASELLTSELCNQIVPKDLELLTHKVTKTLEDFEKLSFRTQTRFEQYSYEVSGDLKKLCYPSIKCGGWRVKRLSYNFLDSLKWTYRWLNRLLTKDSAS